MSTSELGCVSQVVYDKLQFHVA